MRNIQARIQRLGKSFPPVEDEGPYPKVVTDAALRRLSEEDLLLLSSILKAAEQAAVPPPWTEQETQAVEAYNSAVELESRLHRIRKSKRGRR